MSEAQVSYNTKEEVAYKLLVKISKIEDLSTREGVLDLYAECLEATSGQRDIDEE